MAREKNSTTFAEAAVFAEEQSTAPTTKVISPPGKKKVLGKRSGDIVGSGNTFGGSDDGSFNRPLQKTTGSGKNGAFGGRGKKTLGWFLNDNLFESSVKSSAENFSSSLVEAKDDGGPKALSDNLSFNKAAMRDDVKKRGKRYRQRQFKKLVENKAGISSQVMDDLTAVKGTSKLEYNKEDYCYYDPGTNGFYYELKGSRGWRRNSLAVEQQRLQVEQETMKFWRDAGGMAVDIHGNVPMSQNYFLAPQIRQIYDAESDGFYFEMPSADGWKKRQPNSNSSSSVSSNGSVPKCGPGFSVPAFAQIDEGHPISYGAALARGQLPPSSTFAPTITYLPEPFSSDTSSMATLSEGAPTPPPHNYCEFSSLVEQERVEELLIERYESSLKLEESFSPALAGSDKCESPYFVNQDVSGPNLSTGSKKQVTSYADVAAASFNGKVKSGSALAEHRELHRPTNLQITGGSVSSEDIGVAENVNERDLLLNFNADKFISDLLQFCPNPQRFMRDLAALKTPVQSRSFGLDTPIGDGLDLDTVWSNIEGNGKLGLPSSEWSTNSLTAERPSFNGEVWALSGDLVYQSQGKSKLSLWCNNNVLTSALVDK